MSMQAASLEVLEKANLPPLQARAGTKTNMGDVVARIIPEEI